MRYVIIRDDDTNALTPIGCLERLYRPFLDRGLPVNLATIPDVTTAATRADGKPEGFLTANEGNGHGNSSEPGSRKNGAAVAESGLPLTCSNAKTMPIGSNDQLVRYLRDNPGYHILQHGCHHDYLEFDRPSRGEVGQRLDRGTELLREAGFPKPQTFVAPYDKLSRAALLEVSARFRVLSTGWYELRRLPCFWWPQYALKKLRHAPHWQVGRTLLLSHPGCLLSCERTYSTMLAGIIHYLNTQPLTVLVTHWWEYFRNGRPDREFIDFLHETASYLATHPHLKVISFTDLANSGLP
jgi:hypothetical protein